MEFAAATKLVADNPELVDKFLGGAIDNSKIVLIIIGIIVALIIIGIIITIIVISANNTAKKESKS